MSNAQFDKWYNSAGQPMGAVLQIVQTTWSTNTTTTSEQFNDVAGSSISITPRGDNSLFLIRAICETWKTDTNAWGGGLQIYRSAPTAAELWTPFSTWGVYAHDGGTGGAGGATIQFLDDPKVAAGTTVAYKLRVAKYTGGASPGTYTSGSQHINYPGTWSGYGNSSNIIVMEIQGV